jgi:hypothetical protein
MQVDLSKPGDDQEQEIGPVKSGDLGVEVELLDHVAGSLRESAVTPALPPG